MKTSRTRNLMTKRYLVPSGLAALLFLGACSSDKGVASLVSCEPESAQPGETVVCDVTNFVDGCFVLVGQTRVETSSDAEDETVTFAVPEESEGTVDLSLACSPEETSLVKGFVIEPAETLPEPTPEPSDTCQTNADCPAGLFCSEWVCKVVLINQPVTTLPEPTLEPSDTCQTNADCPAGLFFCSEGVCKVVLINQPVTTQPIFVPPYIPNYSNTIP